MKFPFVIEPPVDETYTTIHFHPDKNQVFIGTSRGCIEMWDIDKQEKVCELRYLIIDDYGDQIPVDDPVVSIAANLDNTLIYGLMGNAAYCIDVEMRVIIQQIPISELVISGALSMESGNIGVMTEVGYLSEWSPKFYERIASYEFLFSMDEAYITYGIDDSLIIVMKDQLVIFGKEDDKKFLATVLHDELNLDLSSYLERVIYDRNNEYQALIEDGNVIIQDIKISLLPQDHPFQLGKLHADLILKEKIANIELGKDYIEDFRLERRGKDRYVAESDAIKSGAPVKSSSRGKHARDDAKTLLYAFDDFEGDDIHKKSMAQVVISEISKRHDVSTKYLTYAWGMHSSNKYVDLIEFGRSYEFTTYYRVNRVRLYLILTSLISILLPILSHQWIHINSFYVQIIFWITSILLILYWRKLNRDPHLPWIEEYKLFRLLNLLIIFYIFVRMLRIYTIFGEYLQFIKP